MKRSLASLAAALALLALAAPAAAKDTWLSVRSQNFLLIGNASEREIRQVGARLEQFRHVFLRLFPQTGGPATTPTTVVVFKSDDAYKPFKPLYNGRPQEHLAGYFQQGEDVNYITLTAAPRADGNPFGTIFHEYTHLLVANNLSDPPVWFNEGLAEYYSTFELTDDSKRIMLGKPIPSHVLLLRRQFMRLEDLLRVTHDSPAYNEGDKRTIFYAEAWAFVHFLLQGDKGQRVPQLARFSELLRAGTPLEESFRRAFESDFATVEKALRKYVQSDTYRVQFFPGAPALEFDAEMQTSPLEEARALAYLGDLLYHTHRYDDAEKYLRRALALAPDLAPAHATLGIVNVRQHRYDEALQALARATALDPQSYLAHYYLAEALHRQALGPDSVIVRYPPPVAARMRAALKRSLALNPRFAEACHLLAFLDMVNEEELVDATALVLRARELRPDRLRYVITLSRVYMRREQFDPAREVLRQLLRGANADGQTRADARATLELIDSYESQRARVRAVNAQVEALARGQLGGDPAARLSSAAPPDEAAPPAPEPTPRPEDLRPRIKRRTDGPQVRGLLRGIDCTGGESVVFQVQAADGRLYKFHAEQFNRVKMVAYVPGFAGTNITCGPVKQELFVVLTYRPAPPQQPRPKYDGEAIALDLITKDMEVEPE
ncbi:MAG TPA: tetratricopeptide repeat protein [Pyrinomonadaceae bacterium]|jgi:tetratricopeptide (TPR) repeat protein